jgi:hypothetical protein
VQRRKASKEGWAKIFSIDEPNTGCSGPSSGARRAQERERGKQVCIVLLLPSCISIKKRWKEIKEKKKGFSFLGTSRSRKEKKKRGKTHDRDLSLPNPHFCFYYLAKFQRP